MFAQLNRFMSLLVLCGLLTQPAIAAPDGYQTLVVNGDTLVVQMAEPLPAGYQTIVVGDDTLMVQVLAEPRLANEPSLAASDDSLSAQTKTIETSLDYWIGRIEQDTTWHDTVYVGGDVTIASGAILTLAPDTQVHFLPYHDDTQGGLDSTRAELIVEGQLHAHAGGIVFRSAATTSLGADWYGIVIKRSGLADVSNATIRDGRHCLHAKMGGRVTMDHIAFANCGKQTAQSFSRRSAASDSLSEQMEAMANRNLRIAKKVAVGTLSGLTTTLVAVWVQDKILEPTGDPDTDAWRPISFYFVGAAIGLSIGFPLGVTLVDPCDSFSKTLLAGVIPGMIGMPLLSPFTSLYASEKWRKPPEFSRVSFGLAPTFNGGLSAVAQLRF